MPSISPNTVGSFGPYTISASKGVIADLRLDVVSFTPVTFTARWLTAAPAVVVTLVRGGTSLVISGGVDDSATFANRRVISTPTPAGADTVLTCSIEAISAPAMDESWTVRMSSTAPGTWQFTQPDNNAGDLTITRLMCDPVAGFTVSHPASPGSAMQDALITLTATAALGPAAAPTVVGLPVPTVSYQWTHTGTIAVPGFPGCSAAAIQNFCAPGVYGPQTIQLTEQVWFESPCPAPGFLNNTSATQPLTINPRTQHLMLVLDRSGSMTGDRWENAKTAARILTHLFIALRDGVNTTDKVGILVFEDAGCGWRSAGIDPLISPKLALGSRAAADAAICGLDFGVPGACTPIGDGLIRAMDLLGAVSVADDPRFTIILLTDGFENAGTVRVDPGTPVPPMVDIEEFVAERGAPSRAEVNSRLTLHAVGLGATVQEDVLDALGVPAVPGPTGTYRHITDVNQLKEAFAHMLALSQTAQATSTFAAPLSPDPGPSVPAQKRYFHVSAQENRIAVAVEWTVTGVGPDTLANNTLVLARRNQDPSGGGFVDLSPAVKKCPTHAFVSVDLATLFGGEASVPATEWRLVHTKSDVPQALAESNVIVIVDLHVSASFAFDKATYRTGEPILVTAQIRAGGEPVKGATVSVELARPGESLGTYLATRGADYKPRPTGGPDPAAPKQLMLTQLLHRDEASSLPIVTPPAIFEDGSAQLFDDGAHHDGGADDGDYANRFVNTDMEGSYTWRFHATGTLSDGSRFDRVSTVSKWVGVKVDPASTAVTTTTLSDSEGTVVRIAIRPKDARGQFLGPFRPHDVRFKTTACKFLAESPDSITNGVVYPQPDGGTMVSHYDGTYSRVLSCPGNQPATVDIFVQGQPLPPVQIGGPTGGVGCLGVFIQWLRRILAWLRKLWKKLFG